MQQIFTEDIAFLLETNRLLSSKLELSELLYTIMDLATSFMKVEASSVLLLDERSKELYFDVAIGGSGEKIKGVRIPLGQGIAGAVAKEGKAAIVQDVGKDPRWRGELAAADGSFVTKSILAVPLKLRGRVIGVVEAMNRSSDLPFTEDDVIFFEAFASQAAVAIENARLFSSLRLEKEKMEKVFHEMADGVILARASGAVVNLNARAQAWFGDIKLTALSDFEKKGYAWEPTVQAILSSGADSGSLEMRRREPKLFILSGNWSRIATGPEQDEYVIFIFRDVTDMRHEQLLQKNFLSMISHKLRTPLVAITGYVPFLREDPGRLSDMQKKAVEAIGREGQHLSYLVEDLIRFTTVAGIGKHATLNMKKMSMAQIVEETLKRLEVLLNGAKAQVEKKMDASASVCVDEGLMVEVFRSLIENAVQFNDKPNKLVHLEVTVEGGRVVFKVVDNGPGIPPEEREKIFSWFHQVEEDFTGQVKGMGLGLAFVKEVLHLHGGTIDVSSTVGRGTIFTVSLPQA